MVCALNEMYGCRPWARAEGPLSAAQRGCLRRIHEAVESFGAPEPLTLAAAFAALRRARPGYVDPGPRATSKRELLSLQTTGGVFARGEDILVGSELHAWRNWREVLLRNPESARAEREQSDVRRPFSDPALVNRRKVYNEFLVGLGDRGLVSFGPAIEAKVGNFFVWKKCKTRLWMILAIRLSNTEFEEPWHLSLPSAAAWSSLECSDIGPLLLSQMDVDNAFYRIRCPPGMSAHFEPPRARREDLLLAGADVGDLDCEYVGARLQVLPMGFACSLFFYQAMVRQSVVNAGLPVSRLVEDRAVPERLGESPLAGVCVDGGRTRGL